VTTPDPRDFVHKPARIEGTIPADYDGPVYYRLRQLRDVKHWFGFKGWNKAAEHIFERFPNYGDGAYLHRALDANGRLLPELAKTIQVDVATRRKSADWERHAHYPLISARVKELIEEFEPGKAVFIPIDARWPDGRVDRYYYYLWGKLSERIFPDVLPPKWLYGSHEDDVFHYLPPERLPGRHWMVGQGYFVVSQQMLERLGDILPKEQVFVPFGVRPEGDDKPHQGTVEKRAGGADTPDRYGTLKVVTVFGLVLLIALAAAVFSRH
jgi:hypothetical protein